MTWEGAKSLMKRKGVWFVCGVKFYTFAASRDAAVIKNTQWFDVKVRLRVFNVSVLFAMIMLPVLSFVVARKTTARKLLRKVAAGSRED